MNDLEGKHVVVTGASGGLGSAVVTELLARGATCHLPMLEAAVPAHLPWKDDARASATTGMALDDEAAVVAYYASLPGLWASVHLVGGFLAAPLVDTALADLEKMFSMNVVSCFLGCREATRTIRKSGEGGRIVNVAARPAIAPAGGMAAYTATKAAVASLTQTLALELAPERIHVNAIVPSIIDTPMNRRSMPDADFDAWPKPAEIAETIAFLISPRNVLSSGALVPVFGRS